MRNFDMDKIKSKKHDAEQSQRATPGPFSKDAVAPATLSRRERRTIEQAQGLVPFAVKLDSALVKRLQALALERQTGLNELVGALLTLGLASKEA